MCTFCSKSLVDYQLQLRNMFHGIKHVYKKEIDLA